MEKAKPAIMIGILLAQSAVCGFILFLVDKIG